MLADDAPSIQGNRGVGKALRINDIRCPVATQALIEVRNRETTRGIRRRHEPVITNQADPGRTLEIKCQSQVLAFINRPVERLDVLETTTVRDPELGKEKSGLALLANGDQSVGQIEDGNILDLENSIAHLTPTLWFTSALW